MRDNIDLGSVEIGRQPVRVQTWLDNLRSFPAIRFFGFTYGRFFLGLIAATGGESERTLFQRELNRLSEELRKANEEIASRKA